MKSLGHLRREHPLWLRPVNSSLEKVVSDVPVRLEGGNSDNTGRFFRPQRYPSLGIHGMYFPGREGIHIVNSSLK